MKQDRTITLCKEVAGIPVGTTLSGRGDIDLPSDWDETEGPCVLWLTTKTHGQIEVPLDAIAGVDILGASTDLYPR